MKRRRLKYILNISLGIALLSNCVFYFVWSGFYDERINVYIILSVFVSAFIEKVKWKKFKFMSRIPKIKKDERVKIYDGEDMLIVAPLSHNASIRYGHKSQWCTSTSNGEWWKRETKRSVLVYIIFYKKDGTRRKEFTKIALKRKFHKLGRSGYQVYDNGDSFIDNNLLDIILGDKMKLIDEYFQEKNKDFYRDKLFEIIKIPVGEYLKGISDRAIKISYHKNGLHFSINAKWKDILKAEVVKSYDESFRIRIAELSPRILKNKIFQAINLDKIDLFKRVNYQKEMPMEQIITKQPQET